MENEIINRVAALVCRKEEGVLKFLLTQERSGFWTLPGGGQEDFDTDITETLRRELREETSLEASDYDFDTTDHVVDFVYQKPTHPRFGMRGRLHGFVVRVHDGVIPQAADDIVAVAWFGYDEALLKLEHEDNRGMFIRIVADIK